MPTYKVLLYPGANPASTPSSWGQYEVDITQYVRRPGNDGGAPISYSWGRQDESVQTDAGQMTLTLDNRDGRFSTDKIDGPYYGLIDTGTPIRLVVPTGADAFNRTITATNGIAAGWGSAWVGPNAGPGSNVYGVDGSKGTVQVAAANTFSLGTLIGANGRDTDITSTIYPLVTAAGASYGAGHIGRSDGVSSFDVSSLEFNTAGTVTLKIYKYLAGSPSTLASLNPIPSATYTAGTPWKLRTQFEGDEIRVKAWPASGSEPANWMLSVTEGDNSGTAVGTFNARFNGNTNSGVNILAWDDYAANSFEWTGNVISWPLRWDITGNNSWAPITAAGTLRRLRQGSNPVQSPLRHQLGSTPDVTGYWPMEEGAASNYFSPVVKGTQPAPFAGVNPAADNSLAGGGPAPQLANANGFIKAQVVQPNGGSGFAAMVLMRIPSMPSTKTRIVRVRNSRGPAVIWDFSIDATNTYLESFGSDGQLIKSTVNIAGFDFSSGWVAWQLETDNTSGSTVYHGFYNLVGTTVFYDQNDSIPGSTVSNVLSMELTGPASTSFAHIWMGKNTLPFVTNTFNLVSSGYAGERAAARFKRIAGEAGISYTIAGLAALEATTEKMGPQSEGTTIAILQACADADYGVLAERASGIELVPRMSRYNLTQGMALTVAAGQIAKVPEPVRDDQRLKNLWTVSRSNGSSATYQNDASVARNGTWDDSAQINVFDDSVLLNHAAFRVAMGVNGRMRWPQFSIDLARNPGLAQYWRGRFFGWRIGITTGVSQVRGNEPDLIMEGFQATIDPVNWDIDINATDARIWGAAVTDDTGIYGRADNEYCTSTALISSTATSLPVTTGQVQGLNMPKWDTTSGLWSGGVDLNVGGERVTVNAVANNTGQAQTFTITARGVNGYAVQHPSGTPVSLWSPATVAL